MAPALSAFRRPYPEIRDDLAVDERWLDLMLGAAARRGTTRRNRASWLGGGIGRRASE